MKSRVVTEYQEVARALTNRGVNACIDLAIAAHKQWNRLAAQAREFLLHERPTVADPSEVGLSVNKDDLLVGSARSFLGRSLSSCHVAWTSA